MSANPFNDQLWAQFCQAFDDGWDYGVQEKFNHKGKRAEGLRRAISALRSAGFAPPMHTGAIHKALQDAFQAGVNEAFADRYIRPSSDLVALKHKLCDAALHELLKAAQEDSRG